MNDWVDQHNNEFVKSIDNLNKSRRAYVRGTGEEVNKKYKDATRDAEAKLHTQSTANWKTKSTKK